MKWLFFNSYFCRFVTGLGIQLLDFKLKKVTLIYFEPNIHYLKIQMKLLFFNSYFIFDWKKSSLDSKGYCFMINLTSIRESITVVCSNTFFKLCKIKCKGHSPTSVSFVPLKYAMRLWIDIKVLEILIHGLVTFVYTTNLTSCQHLDLVPEVP